MMTKPPGFASSSTLPLDEEEESIDESLDEILLEAHDRPLENSGKSLEAVPSSLGSSEADDGDDEAPTRSASSMTLPGTPRGAPLSEITVIAPRPTFADEVREEETKVDPYETAIRAAASRDDGLAGLTSQASQQRDRALRKASLTPPRLSAARPAVRELDDVDFEDADAADTGAHAASAHGDDLSARTPADIPISEDDESAPTGGYLSTSPSGGFQPRLPPPLRTSPPPGRPDIYPGRRIPTPSSDFLPVPSGGFGSGSHYPSIAIPAPSTLESSGRAAAVRADNHLRLPPAGLVGFLVTAFGGGLLVGALLWRGHAPPPPREQPVVSRVEPRIVPNVPTAAVQPIVVKPVAAPTAAAAPTATAPTPAPSMPTLAAETPPSTTTDTPPAIDPSKSASPSKKASSSSSATSRPKKPALGDDDAALGDAPPPPPKPAKSKKKAVVWQDPFAQ
jgi:hypothetical protein